MTVIVTWYNHILFTTIIHFCSCIFSGNHINWMAPDRLLCACCFGRWWSGIVAHMKLVNVNPPIIALLIALLVFRSRCGILLLSLTMRMLLHLKCRHSCFSFIRYEKDDAVWGDTVPSPFYALKIGTRKHQRGTLAPAIPWDDRVNSADWIQCVQEH